MTYQEIKDRLSKCELTLEKLKNGKSTSNDVKLKTEKLNLLRESYIKLLKEADKGVIYTDDEKKAKDLADDGANVKLSEVEGIKFSVDETKSIARKVGKAVALSLKSLGEEVSSMKATKIEENSFDIEINFKGQGPNDSFSFYITEDTLHLTDFSFDKEITDVGVKPSGEAMVNVDVVANELTKHFKAMNEGEVSEAPEGMYYIKIPKDAASQNKAQVIFNDLHGINYELNDDPDGIFMYFKKEDFDAGVIDDLEGDGVHILDTNIPNVNEDAEEDAKNDADYEAGWHDDPRKDEDAFAGEDPKAGSTISGTGFNAPRDKKEDTDDYGRPHVDPKGSRTYMDPEEMKPSNRFKKMTQKEDTDVGHQDDEPSMLGSSAMETAEYAAKLVKKLQKYDQHDGEVDFPHWWQKKLVLAREYISAAYHYLDSEEKQPAIDQLALENVVKEGRGDMERIVDLITDRAAESGFTEAEEAQEVIEAIQDYYKLGGVGENLTYKEPKGIDKVAGGIPYRRHGNKVIISMDLPDDVKERLLKKAKDHGYFAQPNMAGGITITLKDGMYEGEETLQEVDEDRYVRAAFEDLEQVIRNLAHTANISEDEALEMAIRKLEAMLDGRDDLDEKKNIVFSDSAYDMVVHTMKRLAKKYKAGDKSVVKHLKKLTHIKKQLEKAKIAKAAKIGQDQELETDTELREAGPGFKHDCAAKVIHKEHGAGNTIPEKHTLVKEGKKYVVTHYDVLFENGKTVTDIPVNELDIKTTNEHWHKGYKKKKK